MTESDVIPEHETNNNPVATEPAWDRHRVALSLVRRHSALAAGVGLIPVAGVDFAALTGVQLNLINRLCQLYDVKFTRQAGLNVIISLISGTIPLALLTTTFSVLKAVPVVGQFAGSAAMSVNASAVVYALGHVMVRHFESGGNFLNFDAHQARAYFKEKLEEHRRKPPGEWVEPTPDRIHSRELL